MSGLFLVLRVPALTVGLHKLVTFSYVRTCLLQSQFAYPFWAQIVGVVADLFGVISCSTRGLGYILLNDNYSSYSKEMLTCRKNRNPSNDVHMDV